MTKIVHPFAHRLPTIRNWQSRWFASGKQYTKYLKGDVLLREYLEERLRGLYVSTIEIERSKKFTRIIIKTSRPGMVIGRNGEGAQKIKADIEKFMHRNDISIPDEFKVDIAEVPEPEADAKVVAHNLTEGLEKRLPFRRVLKQTLERVMSTRTVLGARIVLSGRLGGAEMSRTEEVKQGKVPLQTIRADVDFAQARARLPYGDIGIKVWINRGEIFEKDVEK